MFGTARHALSVGIMASFRASPQHERGRDPIYDLETLLQKQRGLSDLDGA